MDEKELEGILEAIRKRKEEGEPRKGILEWLETQGIAKKEGRELLAMLHMQKEMKEFSQREDKTRKLKLYGGFAMFLFGAGVWAYEYTTAAAGETYVVPIGFIGVGLFLVFSGLDQY